MSRNKPLYPSLPPESGVLRCPYCIIFTRLLIKGGIARTPAATIYALHALLMDIMPAAAIR